MDAIEAFQALHPNVEIRLVEGSNSNPDAHAWYTDALSSYESGVDLIWCCSTSVDLQALMVQLVTPSVVAIAVRMLITTCRIVVQVFFFMVFYFFRSPPQSPQGGKT